MMKQIKTLLAVSLATGLLALSAAETDGFYLWKNGKTIGFYLSAITCENDAISIGESIFNVNDIDSITFINPDEMGGISADTVFVNFDGQTAEVSPEHVKGITTKVNGANVTLTNSNTGREMTFVLSGESREGSFTYNGDYKACIRLSGLNLKSNSGAALDIKCGKRIALELFEGTDNYLEDAPDSLGQKAALYCRGHLEVSKGGTLTVKGNYTHAIKTKEYMLVKSSTGSITVCGAEGDGIHAGQYFKMNGSTVNVFGVKGDGIQAEATLEGDDDDGQVIIRGGTINVAVSERDVDAIKSDSLMTISGGKFTVTTTGDGCKGLKSKSDIHISGGELTFTQSGKYIVVDNDPSYVTAVKADGNMTVSGGTIVIENHAEAGKGLSADGNIDVSEEDAPLTMNINALGDGGVLDLNRGATPAASTDANDNADEEKPVYRICAALTTTKGVYWKDIVYLYSSDDTMIARMTKTITVAAPAQATRTFFCYDFDAPPSGPFYFGSNNYKSGGKLYRLRTPEVNGPTESTPTVYYYIDAELYKTTGSDRNFSATDYTTAYANATIVDTDTINSVRKYATAAGIKADGNITIVAGTIDISTIGAAAKGISCDQMLTTTGGNININSSGSGLGFALNTATAKGLTSDSIVNLQGGNITIRMTGDGSKGVKSDGTITIGKEGGEGPILDFNISGERYNSSSSAKAIKALGTITINGGESVVETSKEKAEGLESKLRANPSIVFKGGKHYFNCYDDCISSAGGIHFDGGIVVCSGKANDAVDSNYGRVGAITIGDGTIFAYTAHKRNGGLDCDNKSFIQITGNGTAISCGGNTLGVSDTSDAIDSAVQGYFFRNDTIIYEKEKYYTLADASGNNLVTFSFENKTISFLSFFTAKGMRKDESYSVKYSQAAPTDATVEWHGLYLGSTATGQTPVTSFTAK